jgi:hypothetical protein
LSQRISLLIRNLSELKENRWEAANNKSLSRTMVDSDEEEEL